MTAQPRHPLTENPGPPLEPNSPSISRKKKLLLGGMTAALVVLMLEGISLLGLYYFSLNPYFNLKRVSRRLAQQTFEQTGYLKNYDHAFMQIDGELGWVYRPNYKHPSFSSNAQGSRGERTYDRQPPPGVLRIAAFGDSLVYGTEVNDAEAWSAQLEGLDQRMEVLNFGVGGYGMDQALLHLKRRAPDLSCQVVILGLADVNYERILNRYRGFIPSGQPLYKPRFRLDPDGQLELMPIPHPGLEGLQYLVDHPRAILEDTQAEWYYEPLVWENPLYDYLASVRLCSSVASRAWMNRLRPDRFYIDSVMNPRCEAFDLAVALIHEFKRTAEQIHAQPMVLVFPTRDQDIWGTGPRVYEPLMKKLPDMWFVDLADAFRSDPSITPGNLRMPGRHYTPAGNGVVSRAVRQAMIEKGLLPPD